MLDGNTDYVLLDLISRVS